ncbi:T9SS type A sorting domain-containing protein [Ekhidna sp.]
MKIILTFLFGCFISLYSFSQTGPKLVRYNPSDYDVSLQIVKADVGGPEYYKDLGYGDSSRGEEESSTCGEYIYFILELKNVGKHTVYGIPIGGDYFLNGSKVQKLNLLDVRGSDKLKYAFFSDRNIIYDGTDKRRKIDLKEWELPLSKDKNVRIRGGLAQGNSFYLMVQAPFKPTKATYLLPTNDDDYKINGEKYLNTYTFYVAGSLYKYVGETDRNGRPLEPDEFEKVPDQISNNSYPEATYWAVCKYGGFFGTLEGGYLREESDYHIYSSKLQKSQFAESSIKKMYPNPVKSGQPEYVVLDSEIEYPDQLVVEVSNPITSEWRQVDGKYESGRIQLDTSGFKSGTYYVRISYPGKEVQIHRLIVK